MNNRLVCVCNMVTESEIIQKLKKGAKNTCDIQLATKAGTSCGRCLPIIDRIVEEYFAKHPKDPQQKLDF